MFAATESEQGAGARETGDPKIGMRISPTGKTTDEWNNPLSFIT
jgi:hypothetical protein